MNIEMENAINSLRMVRDIQGTNGTWDCNQYQLGMYNGIELALSILENREPTYKTRPNVYLDDLRLALKGPVEITIEG